ncbi:MAG: aminotransferase class I/II-fold pyridoxal phosphate-dependent enzyme [Lachnospiraceae bacterium]
MSELLKNLMELNTSNKYPFHMPGHKRYFENKSLDNICKYDITEIKGFDDLHNPKDILFHASLKAKKLFSTKYSLYLINGSTSGILTSIFSATNEGDKILIARNSHKSVYHAAYLRNLNIAYVYPKIDTEWGICQGITANQIKECIEKEPDIKAVVVTSPTYEGVVSQIKEIAQVLKEKKICLIVDEAHGAHFSFHKKFPISAVKEGADLVIQSLHKTLPAFTQTAILHIASDKIAYDQVKRYYSIFQSSSPSYILMSSIEYCLDVIAEKKSSLWDNILNRMELFYKSMNKLQKLRVYPLDIKQKDLLKIVISTKGTSITGHELFELLYKEYELEFEMASTDYIVGIVTCNDTKMGIDRLEEALFAIDQRISCKEEKYKVVDKFLCLKQELTLSQAMNATLKKINIQDAINRVSGEYIYVYPPGIPIIAPGEKFTEEIIKSIHTFYNSNLNLVGLDHNKVVVVKD